MYLDARGMLHMNLHHICWLADSQKEKYTKLF
jgi:hypothetical protein